MGASVTCISREGIDAATKLKVGGAARHGEWRGTGSGAAGNRWETWSIRELELNHERFAELVPIYPTGFSRSSSQSFSKQFFRGKGPEVTLILVCRGQGTDLRGVKEGLFV